MNVVAQQPTNGYQSTEIGVIPVDWKVSKLGRIGKFKNGINKDADSFGYGLPFINLMDVFGKPHISGNEKLGLINSTEIERKEYNIKESDVLFIRSSVKPSGVGLTSVALQNLKDAVYSGFLIRYRSNDDLTTDFKRHCFYDSGFRNRLIAASTVSANTNINQDALKELQVAYPSNAVEQTAIANALSDVDALLTELEKLIAKKQAIKTATMQQLLTGKTRLPQFATYTEGEKQGQYKGTKPSELGEIPEDWGVCLIDDVVSSLSSGGTPFRGNPSFYKGINRWITSGELKYGVINDTIEKISDDAIKKSHLKVHPEGTFLMAITGLEAAGTRGSCGIVGKPAATNQSCMAIYPNKKLTNKFLFHWYVYNGEDLALTYCQGTKQLSYTAGLLKTLPILLPRDTDEQTAIATILSDMDNEIQTLEQRLTKTRQIKQGMMQELLTGRTRLPFNKK
jgi:type I restriction enzyme S subunit